MNDKEYIALLDKVRKLRSLGSVQGDPEALEILDSLYRQLNLSAETERIYLDKEVNSTLSLDYDGKVTGLSRKAATQLGVSAPLLVGKFFKDLVNDDFQQVFGSFLTECQSKEEAKCRLPLTGKKGLTWCSLKLVNKDKYLSVQVEDITKIKQLEQNFQNQSEFISRILENIPVGIFCRNKNGEFILWNQRCAQMFYKIPNEVLGKTARDIFESDVAAKISALDQTVINERETIEISLAIGYDDKKRIFRMVKTPFIDNDNALMTIAIIQDITEKQLLDDQKRLRIIEEEEIRVRKELENMIAKSEFAIYNLAIEPVPILRYISPNIQRISGFSREKLKENVALIFHSLSSASNATLNQIFTEDCPEKISIEYPFKRSDGEEIWLRNEGTLKGKDGAKQLIGFIVDISETKKLENEKKSAINATKFKSEFLAHMSHEIRTPINGVLGLNKLLLKTDLNEEQSYYVELIQKSASSLLEIINDILDISKIESGKMTLESHPFKLVKFLSETLEIMGVQAEQKKLDFKVHLGSLPNAVNGDSKHLGQIIRNLVNNAIKFTNKGYIQVIAEEIERQDDIATIEFIIRDSGIGIPKDKLSSIFSSFTQASSSISRQYGGTGLGLNICKNLIEMMQGHISVESTQNKGTSFRFTVKFQLEYDIKDTLKNIEIDTILASNNDQWNILIIEDNEINQLVLSGLLKKLGNLKIVCTNNGALGVEEFKKNHYDLVFMDCQMPVMDGFTATRAIREYEGMGKYTPIIAITANAMNSAREECMNAGMDEYITKPIEENKLKEIFQSFICQLPPKPNALAQLREQITALDEDFELAPFNNVNLKALGDPYLIGQIVEAYTEAIVAEIDKLKIALVAQDLDEANFVLHSIKGLSGNVGATGVYEKSRQLSDIVKEHGCTAAAELLEELGEIVDEYNEHADRLLSVLTKK